MFTNNIVVDMLIEIACKHMFINAQVILQW